MWHHIMSHVKRSMQSCDSQITQSNERKIRSKLLLLPSSHYEQSQDFLCHAGHLQYVWWVPAKHTLQSPPLQTSPIILTNQHTHTLQYELLTLLLWTSVYIMDVATNLVTYHIETKQFHLLDIAKWLKFWNISL